MKKKHQRKSKSPNPRRKHTGKSRSPNPKKSKSPRKKPSKSPNLQKKNSKHKGKRVDLTDRERRSRSRSPRQDASRLMTKQSTRRRKWEDEEPSRSKSRSKSRGRSTRSKTPANDLTTGEAYRFKDDRVGILRWQGKLKMKNGLKTYYYGFELGDDFLGKNDGMYEGEQKFKCKKGQGVFVPRSKVAQRVPLHFCVITQEESMTVEESTDITVAEKMDSKTDILEEEEVEPLVENSDHVIVTSASKALVEEEPIKKNPNGMKAHSDHGDKELSTRKKAEEVLVSVSEPSSEKKQDPCFIRKASKPDPGIARADSRSDDSNHQRVSSARQVQTSHSLHDRIVSAPAAVLVATTTPSTRAAPVQVSPNPAVSTNADSVKASTPPLKAAPLNLPFLRGNLFAKPTQQIAYEKLKASNNDEALQKKRDSLNKLITKVRKSGVFHDLVHEANAKHRESLDSIDDIDKNFKTSKNRNAFAKHRKRRKLAGVVNGTETSISDVSLPDIDLHFNSNQITVGCKVVLQDGRIGKVVYDGNVEFADGRMLGVILDEGNGEHDGKVNGRRYFGARKNGAVFRSPSALSMLKPAVRLSAYLNSQSESSMSLPSLPNSPNSREPSPRKSAFPFLPGASIGGDSVPDEASIGGEEIFSDLIKKSTIRDKKTSDSEETSHTLEVSDMAPANVFQSISREATERSDRRVLPNDSTDEFVFIPKPLRHLSDNEYSGFEVRKVHHKNQPVLTQTKSQELNQVFKAFDGDRNGKISVDEIFAQFHGELSHEEIERMVASVDENHNGEIDIAEFGQFMEKYALVGSPVSSPVDLVQSFDQTRILFDSMDKDGDGLLTADDLSEMLSIPVEESKELMRLITGLSPDEDSMNYETFSMFCNSMGGFGDLPTPHSSRSKSSRKESHIMFAEDNPETNLLQSTPRTKQARSMVRTSSGKKGELITTVEDAKEKIGLIQMAGSGILNFRQDASFSEILSDPPAFGGVAPNDPSDSDVRQESFGGVSIQREAYGGVSIQREAYGGVSIQHEAYGGVSMQNPPKGPLQQVKNENHSRKPSFFDDEQKADVVFKCHCAMEAGFSRQKVVSLKQNFVYTRQENVADLCIYVVQQTENALRDLVPDPGVLNGFLQASIMVSNQGTTELAIPLEQGAILAYVRYETDELLKRVDGVIEIYRAPSEKHAKEFRRLLRM